MGVTTDYVFPELLQKRHMSLFTIGVCSSVCAN